MLPSIFGWCYWKKGEYVTCLICHQKVSFNKYSWTTPRQHMRKHNINSPSDVETVLQLAKQCWKEGRDFPEERLPRAGNSKGRPRTRKITDYQAGGGFRPHARGTMAYSRVRRAMSLWIAMDCLPYAAVDTPAFRAMLRALDPQAPDMGLLGVGTLSTLRVWEMRNFPPYLSAHRFVFGFSRALLGSGEWRTLLGTLRRQHSTKARV